MSDEPICECGHAASEHSSSTAQVYKCGALKCLCTITDTSVKLAATEKALHEAVSAAFETGFREYREAFDHYDDTDDTVSRECRTDIGILVWTRMI
jgi:hypothetical protein